MGDDLPEDELVEFQQSWGRPLTFPAQGDRPFSTIRAHWRQGAREVPPSRMSVEAVDALFTNLTSPDARLPRPVPLAPFIKYLWVLWPEAYPDFPSPAKIGELGLDELLEGDWQYIDDLHC